MADLLRFFAFYVNKITCKVFHVSSSNFLCMILISSSRTSAIMAAKKSKWPIYCDFSHFTSTICLCGRDTLKSVSCILFKFVMHDTNKQFSDKFNCCSKSSIMAAGYCRVYSCLKMLPKFKMAAKDRLQNGRKNLVRNYSNLTITFPAIWRCAGDFFNVLLKFKMAARGQFQFFCRRKNSKN